MANDVSNDVIILDGSEEDDGGIELIEQVPSTSSSSKPSSEAAEVVISPKGINPPEVLTSDSEDEWDIISIEDDDDGKPKIDPKNMKCFCCRNKGDRTFRNEKKYWIHISRHILPDSFSCVTCKRPFTKLTHCLSHELRVHGTSPGKERQSKKSEANTNDDNEVVDCEDVRFYNDYFVGSSSMYPYRGPTVKNRLESYEIQDAYSSRRPKSSRTNQIAKLALAVHKLNVRNKTDIFRLGRFSNKKNRFATKEASKRTPSSVQMKRPENVISESESTKEKPRKRRKGGKEPEQSSAGMRTRNRPTSNAINAVESPTKKGAVRRGRSRLVEGKPEVVEPDQSFSPKELFLHSLGLVNSDRLQLDQKK